MFHRTTALCPPQALSRWSRGRRPTRIRPQQPLQRAEKAPLRSWQSRHRPQERAPRRWSARRRGLLRGNTPPPLPRRRRHALRSVGARSTAGAHGAVAMDRVGPHLPAFVPSLMRTRRGRRRTRRGRHPQPAPAGVEVFARRMPVSAAPSHCGRGVVGVPVLMSSLRSPLGRRGGTGGACDGNSLLQQLLNVAQRHHDGAVAGSSAGVRVRFDEEATGTNSGGGAGDGPPILPPAAGDS